MELAQRGIVAYGKLFSKKAGLVSREWYPDLANCGYDFDSRYEEGPGLGLKNIGLYKTSFYVCHNRFMFGFRGCGQKWEA